jgi:Gluconate 2-dehydrogenase subunit 3
VPESAGRGVGAEALNERQTPRAETSSAAGTPGTRRAGSSGTPGWLRHQRRGTSPQMRGRYPDYDVLAEARHWDEPTRAVVLARVASPPAIRFFSDAEARALRAFCDVVTAQEDEPRVPVLEMVDAKLYEGKLDGFRYHDMPADTQTWRGVAAHLDRSAAAHGYPDGFAAAPLEARRDLVQEFSEGKLQWEGLRSDRAWTVVMRAVLAAFYSHPWAWNEIGFGGPAYPRGFARLAEGQREHWERAPESAPAPARDAPDRGLQ